jgi:hypothetical protein
MFLNHILKLTIIKSEGGNGSLDRDRNQINTLQTKIDLSELQNDSRFRAIGF